MNPFESLNSNFNIDRLNQFKQMQKSMAYAKSMPTSGVRPQAGKPTGRGGTLTSLISEGGAAGGALAGAAAGSVVPVLGTAIGGIIGAGVGAFGGRLAENKVRDDRWGVGDAAKEGAASAVLAGPLKLLKYGKTLSKGKGLVTAADDAAKYTLRGSVGKGVEKTATRYATKQFGLTDNYLSKYASRYKEDAGKTISRYGFSSADDVAGQITKQNEIFDSLIGNAGMIKKTTLQKNLDGAADDLLKKIPTQYKQQGQNVIDEARSLMDNFGDDISPTELNQVRKQFDSLVNYTAKTADPNKYEVNKRISDVLRNTIQKASGGSQLKETGKEMSKLISLQEEIAKRAPAVSSRAASPLGFRNLVGGAIGGSAGGPVGAGVGLAATAAVNSPTGRRMAFKGANAAAGLIGKGTGKATSPMGMAASTLFRQPVEGMLNQPAPSNAQSLEDATMTEGFGFDQEQQQQNFGGMNQNSFGGDQYGMPQESANPYPKENLMYDIQRDPENAAQYIAQYKSLEEIFGIPETAGSNKLTQTAITKLNDFETSLDNLDEVERIIGQKSSSLGPISGRLRSLNPYDTTQTNINQATLIAAQNIGRSLEGGKLTDADIARYQRALPGINDTPATARDKIARLRDLISRQKTNYSGLQAMYGGGGSSLEDMLMQQTGAMEEIY